MGTAVALLTARVWVLCGGDGAVSTGTECLSAGVGVRRGVAGSLSNWVGVQSCGTPAQRNRNASYSNPEIEEKSSGIRHCLA